jgi:hypothetical protein
MEREEERVVPVPLAVDVGMEVGEVRPHLVVRLVTSTTGLYMYLAQCCGSGIGLFPDPGSQTHIFDNLMTNIWVKNTIILSVLAKEIFFTCSKMKLFTISQFYDICGSKKW